MSRIIKGTRARTVARYGAVLGHADDALLAEWCGPSRLKQRLFRAYCKWFGYPELAAHRRNAMIRDALRSRPCARVVDVGVRNGLYILADAMSRPETKYVGVDISRTHLRRLASAVRQFGVAVRPMVARAEAIGLASQSADLVLTIEVLQFVTDDRRAVSEIGRILSNGGLWWCEQELETVGQLSAPGGDPTLFKHRRGHTTARMVELAREAGMRLLTAQPMSGAAGRWWERLESRIRAKNVGLHLLVFPVLRVLATLTAGRRNGGSPATVLYCFERRSSEAAPLS